MSLAGLDADRDDECADGSHECSFVCLWPLDGSAAAGADLQENSKWQTFQLFTKLAGGVDSLLGRLLQPGGAQLLEAQIRENTANRCVSQVKVKVQVCAASSTQCTMSRSMAACDGETCRHAPIDDAASAGPATKLHPDSRSLSF